MPNFDPTPLLTLISTRTIDRVHGPNGREEVPGGPARYVGEALDRLGRAYQLLTGPRAEVEIRVTDEGLQYAIPALPRIPLPSMLTGAVILSPIMREIDPSTVPTVDGLLAVDVQGFVRLPGGGLGRPDGGFRDLLGRVDVLKVSDEEVGAVPEEWLDLPSILLLTQGERGAQIRQGGRWISVPVQRVPVTNTIGAGDTFLAAFVCALLDGAGTRAAGERAARFTESFLGARLSAD